MKFYVSAGIVLVLFILTAGFVFVEKADSLGGTPLHWYFKLTGQGPDEVGLSPGENRPHSLPLNNPSFVQGKYAEHVRPDDLVVGVVIKGQARAYPWWVVRNHHVINDTIVVHSNLSPVKFKPTDDQWTRFERVPPSTKKYRDRFIPLLITLCEACSGASAYIPTVTNSVDRPLVFAQCRSDGSWAGNYVAGGVFTICDMQTHSRWHPFTGKARSGPLEGKQLRRVPVRVDTWQVWLKEFPETLVVLAGGEMRLRTHVRMPGAELGGDAMGGTMTHPSLLARYNENPESLDHRFNYNELVMGISNNDGSKSLAYPLVLLKAAGGVVEHEFEGDAYLYIVSGSYGVAVFKRKFKDDVLTFEIVSREPLMLKDQNGTSWNELGEAIEGPDKGALLSMVADSYLAEWSEWILEHEGADVVTKNRRRYWKNNR